MRCVIVAALLLAACSQQAAPTQVSQDEKDIQLLTVQAQKMFGVSAADARGMAEQVVAERNSPANVKRAAAHAAERDRAVRDVQASACKSDPGLSYC